MLNVDVKLYIRTIFYFKIIHYGNEMSFQNSDFLKFKTYELLNCHVIADIDDSFGEAENLS